MWVVVRGAAPQLLKLVRTTHRLLAASFSWLASFFFTDPDRKKKTHLTTILSKRKWAVTRTAQRIALSCRVISCGAFPSTALATAQRRAVTSFVSLVDRAARLRSFAVVSLGTRHSRPVRSFRTSSPFNVSVGACYSTERHSQFDFQPDEPLRMAYGPRP